MPVLNLPSAAVTSFTCNTHPLAPTLLCAACYPAATPTHTRLPAAHAGATRLCRCWLTAAPRPRVYPGTVNEPWRGVVRRTAPGPVTRLGCGMVGWGLQLRRALLLLPRLCLQFRLPSFLPPFHIRLPHYYSFPVILQILGIYGALRFKRVYVFSAFAVAAALRGTPVPHAACIHGVLFCCSFALLVAAATRLPLHAPQRTFATLRFVSPATLHTLPAATYPPAFTARPPLLHTRTPPHTRCVTFLGLLWNSSGRFYLRLASRLVTLCIPLRCLRAVTFGSVHR